MMGAYDLTPDITVPDDETVSSADIVRHEEKPKDQANTLPTEAQVLPEKPKLVDPDVFQEDVALKPDVKSAIC